MLTRAARDLGVVLAESYMVGDGLTDIEAGSRAGCRTIFVGRWKCEHCQFIHPSDLRPTFIAKDLQEAVQLIRTDLRDESDVIGLATSDQTKCVASQLCSARR